MKLAFGILGGVAIAIAAQLIFEASSRPSETDRIIQRSQDSLDRMDPRDTIERAIQFRRDYGD